MRRKGELRVDTSAKGRSSFFAVAAAAVGYVEWHYDSVSLLQEGDAAASFDNYAHIFMAYGF